MRSDLTHLAENMVTMVMELEVLNPYYMQTIGYIYTVWLNTV